MITSTSNELVSLYSHFSKNRFPLSGGLLDQPAVFVGAMEIIESAVESNDE